ncbi:unnamed protein product [Ectocarpus sp. 12 AP-2014]
MITLYRYHKMSDAPLRRHHGTCRQSNEYKDAAWFQRYQEAAVHASSEINGLVADLVKVLFVRNMGIRRTVSTCTQHVTFCRCVNRLERLMQKTSSHTHTVTHTFIGRAGRYCGRYNEKKHIHTHTHNRTETDAFSVVSRLARSMK